jgi:hypothetical protein
LTETAPLSGYCGNPLTMFVIEFQHYRRKSRNGQPKSDQATTLHGAAFIPTLPMEDVALY